jgi:hypothetical protein
MFPLGHDTSIYVQYLSTLSDDFRLDNIITTGLSRI